MEDYRIVFMGTPRFASTALGSLYEAGFKLSSVITQPDKETGRGRKLEASAVKIEAEKLNLPVFQPSNKAELTAIIDDLKPDLIVVAAFGMIIPDEVLNIPKFGTLNIHGSLLPRYRGGSCIQEAILNDEKTGITIMKIVSKMDAGPIISTSEVKIEPTDTKDTLERKLSEAGAKEIVRIIPLWVEDKVKAKAQNETEATYCKLIKKEDGKIDWSKPADTIEKMTRAYYPWPTAYTFLDGKMLKIISAKVTKKDLKPGEILVENGSLLVGTGQKALDILKLQPEGKKEMTAKDFLNGQRDLKGKIFTN